ncbi:16S rRNA (cytidine(1402)-2'-O)-methyltransferase [Candidatus Shapirobacteria bacterium CG11_big_fil_rev_8_21_14_0_20_40_12]|uniref:Ribosomal RNA small subunit methyltransferase I n=1 Tax=Candidatus Shapirobacteria bacterium CG11_big_fil_rev_8_21_14_0_20_40_12 TaxID=1974889 RepID=A0A2H0KFB4_9BACT|nr:MAG: 16S rRNA (cytidine(1402)-2'-O)-methyltransferase [Candidatus Shapirobacteria bacterium CG11_big_fil_rev_8_21_14_0_20_40_12]
MLYIVATPIGNLDDITLRALNTLFTVDVVFCEDTRKTLNLLRLSQKTGQVIPKLVSYFEENEFKRIPEIVSDLEKGTKMALVTNSGTPTISDPGFKLVRECRQRNIPVISIPGPSSPIAALACSGLPTDKFLFLGFLPNKQSHRRKIFENVKESLETVSATVIFFESPFRLIKSLMDLKEVFGDIEIVICRELTKIYEEVSQEKVSNFVEEYSQKKPRGEFVVLFNLK